MTELLDWFFPTIIGNGTLIAIVAGAAVLRGGKWNN